MSSTYYKNVTKPRTKWLQIAVAVGAAVALTTGIAARSFAVTNNEVTVTPTSSGASNVVGVEGDAAPGFETGSIASTGTTKNEFYFTSESLFGENVQLSDIASMSYWTKKDSTHVEVPGDWYLNLYTAPYAGDVSTAAWYGERIGAEPYFSQNLVDPVDTWNEWSTDGEQNQLRFFESTAGAPGADFGAYDDPAWSDFVAGNALSGQTYADRTVTTFSLQTGSGWVSGFEGQVDGLTITLNDGSVATVNFEADQPVVNGENFNTHSGADYRGVNVGFNVANFEAFESVTVSLLDADRNVLVTNTGTQDLFDLYASGTTQFSTPFITSVGTYDVEGDTYWDFGTWNSTAKPVYAVITVNGIEEEITPLTEPNGVLFADLKFDVVPGKEACKNNGWKVFSANYKNQGQCVASVTANANSAVRR